MGDTYFFINTVKAWIIITYYINFVQTMILWFLNVWKSLFQMGEYRADVFMSYSGNSIKQAVAQRLWNVSLQMKVTLCVS